MTDQQILDKLSDVQTLALTMMGEAGGDSREGRSSLEERVGVACVIRNRAREPHRYGDSLKAVCLKKWQFSCWNAGDPNRVRLLRWAYLFATGQPVLDPLVEESVFLAHGIATGILLDRVQAANHYCTTALLVSPSAPAWAFLNKSRTVRREPVAICGSHTFFRL